MAQASRKKKSPRPAPSPKGKAKKAPLTLPQASVLPAPAKPLQLEMFILMALGAFLIGALYLQLSNFRWLGSPFYIPPEHWNFIFYLSIVLIAWGARSLPRSIGTPDLPRLAAYPILALILGVAAYFRLTRWGEPVPSYWDDSAVCIIDPAAIVEQHIFKIVFPIGLREPLHGYVTAAVWWLCSGLKPIVIQRLAASLFDLTAVYVFYLLGREVAGRRGAGLLFAAFGAVSKPMILQNLCGMGGVTLTLGVALLLLFQVRVFRNPKLSHFLEWGLALAFGIYTYISIRPWVLFLFTVTILWILFKHRKDKNRWALWPVLILFATGYFLFFLDKLLFVFHDNWVSQHWGGNWFSFVAIQAVFLAILVYFYRTSQAKEREMISLALGLMLAGFLIYPFAMAPGISAKIANISILPKDPRAWFNPALFHQIKDGVNSTTAAMFSGGPDRADMNVVNDAFFDYHAVVWVILGLIFAAARPSWLKFFFVMCAAVGVAPHVMTSDPQSAKMLGAMPPLLLLASLAVDQWIEGAVAARGTVRWLGVALALSVTAFWGWEMKGTYERVYGEWWKITSPDVFVYRQLQKDTPNHRVYLSFYNGMGFFSTAVEGVLNYGTPVYACGDTNTIDVLPGAPRSDVALIVCTADQKMLDRVKKEFPKAQWNPCWQYYQTPGVGNPFMYDIWIPAAQVPDKPGKLFMFHTVSQPGWLRRIYISPVGLAGGLIRYESIVPTLNPLPVEAGANSVSCEDDWEAPADGHYTFSVKSQDVIKLLMDGKILINIKPYGSASKTLYLEKGKHKVEYLGCFKSALMYPNVTIKDKDINFVQVLGSQ